MVDMTCYYGNMVAKTGLGLVVLQSVTLNSMF